MLKKMWGHFTLPLLLLIGISWENTSAQSPPTKPEGRTGTLEKLIVASGNVTMDFDLGRLRGTRSEAQELKWDTVRFEVSPNSFFKILVFNNTLRGPEPGSMALTRGDSAILPEPLHTSSHRLVIEERTSDEPAGLVVRDGETGFVFFNIEGNLYDYDATGHSLVIRDGRLLISASLAHKLGRPAEAGVTVGKIAMSLTMHPIEITAVVNGEVKSATLPAQSRLPDVPESVAGPDVIVGELSSLQQFGSSGTQVGLAMGTDSCNNGDAELNFFAMPNTDHPVMPQNLYRMSGGAANDERFEQIGQSWLPHGFFALQNNACAFGCIPASDGTHLGAGCSNADTAGINAGPANLGSRAWVNPFTGVFPSTANSHTGHTHTGTSHRILVEGSDLDMAMNPGATYYGEAQFVTPHEYTWCQAHPGQCNMYNNASYRRFNVNGTTSFVFSPNGSTVRMAPAINAWPGATIRTIEPAPGTDGRAFLAFKVTGPVAGLYHYEYAIYNQNLDRGIQSFSVPRLLIPGSNGADLMEQNVQFHAPPQHPGFPADGTQGDAGFSSAEWTFSAGALSLTWNSETFAQNPNANAIRWGTLYNFRFDSATPPVVSNATVGFFKTGAPIEVAIQGPAPVGGTPTPAPTPGPAMSFQVIAPPVVVMFTGFNFTVRARDQFNHTVPNYTGTVHFSTTSEHSLLPPDSTLMNGFRTFSGDLESAGTQTITATDTANPSITGTSNDILVLSDQPTPPPTPTPTPTLGTPTPTPPCNLVQGFDDITTLPGIGWVQTNHSTTVGTTGWFQGNSTVFPAHQGAATSYIGANFNNTTNADTISNWLLTPPLMLLNGRVLTFWTRTVDAPAFPDRLQVRMSTNGTSANVGTTATDVGDFTVLLLDINPTYTLTGYPNVWTQFTVTVSGVASPTTGRLALRYFVENGGPNGANSDYIGIDTLQTTACGDPPPPTPTPTPTSTVPPCSGTAFSENFDGGVAPTPPPASGWVISNVNPDTPPNDAFAEDPAVISNKVLDFSGLTISSPLAQVSFRNNYNLESSGGKFFDGGVLEISSPNINAGAFTDVTDPAVGGSFVSGGYSGIIGNGFGSPIAGRQAWAGNSGGYVTTVVRLGSNLNGQTIALRFRMASDSSGSGVGWRIDTITSVGVCVAGTATPTPTATMFPTPFPEPAVQYAITAPSKGDVNLPLGFAVMAQDKFGNTDPKYAGTVHFTSSDPTAQLPPDSTLTNGTGTFNATFHMAGSQTITATDTQHAFITGTSNPINIFKEPPPPSPTPSPTATPTLPPHPLNVSTRLNVRPGDDAGIGGFIITGTASKHLLFRGIGPSLNTAGVPDALANPTLDLRDSSGVSILANDNWRDTQEPEIIATGIPPSDNLEAAIVATLAPGSYTVILRGLGATSGVGLVEIYDLDQGTGSKLANLSTRAFVGTGNNVVIAGFILGGPDLVVVRGIGPSLTAAGVANALADPTLELRDSDGTLLIANNDWKDDPFGKVGVYGLGPSNPLESALIAALPPGLYTAVLAGRNEGTGVGLVEIYDLSQP